MSAPQTAFQVEDDIPPQPRGRARSKGYTDVLRSLEVGQSVVLPTSSESIHALCRRIDGKFSVAAVGKIGFRVWRIV